MLLNNINYHKLLQNIIKNTIHYSNHKKTKLLFYQFLSSAS